MYPRCQCCLLLVGVFQYPVFCDVESSFAAIDADGIMPETHKTPPRQKRPANTIRYSERTKTLEQKVELLHEQNKQLTTMVEGLQADVTSILRKLDSITPMPTTNSSVLVPPPSNTFHGDISNLFSFGPAPGGSQVTIANTIFSSAVWGFMAPSIGTSASAVLSSLLPDDAFGAEDHASHQQLLLLPSPSLEEADKEEEEMVVE
jgi:hypothetical protein